MWLLTCKLVKIKENLKFCSLVALAVFQMLHSYLWLGAPTADSGHRTFPPQQEILLDSTVLDIPIRTAYKHLKLNMLEGELIKLPFTQTSSFPHA